MTRGKTWWHAAFVAITKKATRPLGEMGWALDFAPKMPAGNVWMVRGAERFEPEWNEYLAFASAA
jgi:hypothetical protein